MTNEPTTDAAAAGAQTAAAGYEFDSPQEVVIRELAGTMQFVGTVSIVLAVVLWIIGIVTMFAGNLAGLGQVMQGVLLVFIGAWTRSAARSFQLVVDTKGSDIPNLMNALGELSRLYTLQRWLMILALVLFVGAFVLGVAAALMLSPGNLPS